MLTVEEVNDPAGLDHYRLAWDQLLGETPGASFFQTLSWLRTYWRHFGMDQRLRVLAVHAAGHPIGFVPLCVRTERFKVGALRVLTYPLHDWGTFYGPIGRDRTALLLASMKHVRHARRDWDLLDLRWTDRDGTDRQRTPGAMKAAGMTPWEQPWSSTAVIDLGGRWKDYFAAQSTRWRENVRRQCRRIAGQGKLEFIRYRPQGTASGDGDPRWDLYDACEATAQRSWQHRSPDGTTLSDECVRGFLRDTHAEAARLGMADLNLLVIDGRPVAFSYGYHLQGRLIGLRTGYDPDFHRYGPGNVLMMHVVRDSFERGDRRIELGPGALHYKRHWASRLEVCYRYTHFPWRGFRVQAVRIKRWATTGPPGAADVEERWDSELGQSGEVAESCRGRARISEFLRRRLRPGPPERGTPFARLLHWRA
jgi:CelD/BcsL family acetyltransferase involved in cellulose biosynthesis